MTVDVTTEAVIECDRRSVAGPPPSIERADVGRRHRAGRVATEPPVATGSLLAFVARLGRRLADTDVVAELVPDERAPGFSKLATPVLATVVRRANRNDPATSKALMEDRT